MMGFFIGWVVLGVGVLGLAIYRKSITAKEQDWVHLRPSEEAMIAEQVDIAKRLKAIDRCGIWLTVVLALYGVVIGSIFVLRVWEAGKTQGM